MVDDWQARFIAPAGSLDAAPLFRREFTLDAGHGEVAAAQLELSALGVCEAFLDGEPVSPDVLTPGWTSYEWRIRHSSTDVTELVRRGASVLGIAVGNGWYRGRLGWTGGAAYYGDDRAAFAELRVTFADGHHQVIATDESWTVGAGSVVSDDLYDGQTIDARRRRTGWNLPGFDADDFEAVRIVEKDLGLLEPYVGPPVRRQEDVLPERIWTSPSGRVLVDFGQNLVGWLRVSVVGPSGAVVSIRHAEVLENDELGVRPLRSAKATDMFVLSGESDTFEPTFTFHGFRYAEVTGWPGGIEAIREGDLVAVVVSSELRRIGAFASSNPLLNRFHENVVWGMRGNFLDVPTDCPQRDERLGWTGDISAFAATAAYLYDVESFLQDWLIDLAAEQTHHDGVVPYVVPDILKYVGNPAEFAPFDSTAIWSDAAVWVPWALWEAYGDDTVLRATFDSMASHVRTVRSKLSASGVWDAGFQFGDWLDPDAPPDAPAEAKADTGVVATASAYRSADLTARAAAILGRVEEQEEFRRMAVSLREAFHASYVSDERILSDCTTVYTLAIAFGLLDENDRVWAGERLARLVADSGYRISTGFAGTPFITDALTSTGHVDAAYRLLLQEESPSWLYAVTMGATTVWERWDSMLPDGSINPGEMTSFNHYALGAVADWMHRVVAGIAPLEPGYRTVLFAPRPGGDLTWAEASVDTPLGLASIHWEREGDGLSVTVRVPSGASGVLRLEGESDVELSDGEHRFRR
ncbi:family 78 glycoside hydrolase catalytic domain [Marisediminicola sp. LYQ85]|uniref:family 78 glycoside hydrolase catalytic domain n=1 Tax=Marisediminicola sp. LYQ85 TaxID=3391062 RepID=UPI0039835A45